MQAAEMGGMQGDGHVTVAKSFFWGRCQFTCSVFQRSWTAAPYYLHGFSGALSQHNTPDFQKCCYLAGQRFLNQLIKAKHLLSNG